jgi:hypothetical protein
MRVVVHERRAEVAQGEHALDGAESRREKDRSATGRVLHVDLMKHEDG